MSAAIFPLVTAIIDIQDVLSIHGFQAATISLEQIIGMQNFSRTAKGNDAMIQQHDAVKMSRSLIEIMRGDHDCDSFFFESVKEIQNTFLRRCIETGERFIH